MVYPENTHHSKGKDHCTAGLQFNRIQTGQTGDQLYSNTPPTVSDLWRVYLVGRENFRPGFFDQFVLSFGKCFFFRITGLGSPIRGR